MLTQEGIMIGGKEYKWARVSIGKFKELQKFHRNSAFYSGVLFDEATEVGGEMWNKAVVEWKQFVDSIFEKPDEGLALTKINDVEYTGILQGFFTGRATDILGLLDTFKSLQSTLKTLPSNSPKATT